MYRRGRLAVHVSDQILSVFQPMPRHVIRAISVTIQPQILLTSHKHSPVIDIETFFTDWMQWYSQASSLAKPRRQVPKCYDELWFASHQHVILLWRMRSNKRLMKSPLKSWLNCIYCFFTLRNQAGIVFRRTYAKNSLCSIDTSL